MVMLEAGRYLKTRSHPEGDLRRVTRGEMKQGLWTAKQAAAVLGVQLRTMSIWRYLGRYPLPFVKKGLWVYYSPADVRAFARTYPAWRGKWTSPRLTAWLTERETAASLGVRPRTLTEWRCNRGCSLGYVKVDGQALYARAKVLAFGKKHRVVKGVLERRSE